MFWLVLKISRDPCDSSTTTSRNLCSTCMLRCGLRGITVMPKRDAVSVMYSKCFSHSAYVLYDIKLLQSSEMLQSSEILQQDQFEYSVNDQTDFLCKIICAKTLSE